MVVMSKKRLQVDLGDQLRAAFSESGMSRFELANRSGVPYSGVHRFIGGDRDLTLASASRLADVLGLELRPVGRANRKQVHHG